MSGILHDFVRYFMFKESKKIQKLKEYGSYIEQGNEEVGNDMGLVVESNTYIKTKRGRMPDSMFMLQAFAGKIARQKKYTSDTYRVLFHFVELSAYENFLSIDVRTISENLEMSERNVSRATKQLVSDNVIIKIAHPIDKRRNDYFINPYAAWRGQAINRDKSIEKFKKNKIQLDMFDDQIIKLK